MHPISWYVKTITPQCQTCFITYKARRSASAIFMSHTEAITLYRKSSAVVKNGGTKLTPWCKHCSCSGWWKGTSQHEATLISESVALELCLSEGISHVVQSTEVLCHASFISRVNTRVKNACHTPLISDYSRKSKCLLARECDVVLEWYHI